MYIISIFLTINSLFKIFLCNLLRENPCGEMSIKNHIQRKGAKKVSFTAYHWGKLLVVCTSPRVFLASPNVFKRSICNSSSVIWISPQKIHLPFGQVKNRIHQQYSPIAKSTSPGLSDATFFAHRKGTDCPVLAPLYPSVACCSKYLCI